MHMTSRGKFYLSTNSQMPYVTILLDFCVPLYPQLSPRVLFAKQPPSPSILLSKRQALQFSIQPCLPSGLPHLVDNTQPF